MTSFVSQSFHVPITSNTRWLCDILISLFDCRKKKKDANYGAYIKLDANLNLSYTLFKAAEEGILYRSIPDKLVLSRNIRRVR